jgi:hypothetical protein
MKIITIRPPSYGSLALLLMGALLFAGCNSDRHNISPEEAIAPRPPDFLIGPAALLLTNGSDYSARLTLERPDSPRKAPAVAGRILGQGSSLLYAPAKGDKTFIWDVQGHSGYVLSESLQGYAPVSSATAFTNLLITAQIAGPASDRVNGHPGHEAEVTITANDGSTARFSVWRAADLNGLPVRIKTLTASAPFELNLFEVRLESLPPSLFLPPDGFAKYGSPELLNTELLARKSKMRNPSINNNPNDERSLPKPKNY